MKSNDSSISVPLSDDPKLTTQQAAKLLGVKARTLVSWRLSDIGPEYIRYGRKCVRYRLSALETFLQENLRGVKPNE